MVGQRIERACNECKPAKSNLAGWDNGCSLSGESLLKWSLLFSNEVTTKQGRESFPWIHLDLVTRFTLR